MSLPTKAGSQGVAGVAGVQERKSAGRARETKNSAPFAVDSSQISNFFGSRLSAPELLQLLFS